MRILIVGGGTVGFSLVKQLSLENHEIAVVEKDPDICQTISERSDVLVVNGSGSTPSALEQAGINEAEMVIAVTYIDEVNILVCSLAENYNVKKRIARVRDHEYSGPNPAVDLSRLGVTQVIDPERAVVDAICQFIRMPGATQAASFQDDSVLMCSYNVPDEVPMSGKSIIQIDEIISPNKLLVMAIIRGETTIIPSGENEILPGDQIISIFPKATLDVYLPLLGKSRKSVRKVVIAGDGLTALHLAATLENLVETVIWITPQYNEGIDGASLLHSTEIIHGDGTDMDVLQEIHVGTADFFVGAGKETQDNVMGALLAKSEGVKETIIISTEPRHAPLFHSLGIDHSISPRLSTAREIMEAVHKGQIWATVPLKNTEIEAVRISASKGSPITEKPLKIAWKKMRKGSIVGAIIRNNTMIIPRGDTVIEPGDDVIVLTRTTHIDALQKMFRSRKKV
ncbi:MAG: Trk system potassium transporter TrkA [Candidatus Theseobacter exili]|nr:Trk system potassium transporter TrkA [Candidatus Theseobacter exili]